jgi:hypothetical protein
MPIRCDEKKVVYVTPEGDFVVDEAVTVRGQLQQ